MNSDCYIAYQGEILLIGNSRLEIGIDKIHGTVVSLKNKVTGTEYINNKYLVSNFRIIYPLPIPDIRDYEIRGEEQIVSSIDEERTSDGGISIIVNYNSLNSDRGVIDLYVSYTITVFPLSDDTIWEITVTNNDKYTVREVWFPYLSGIGKLGPNDFVVLPHQAGDIIEDPFNTFPSIEDAKRFPAWESFGSNMCKLKYRIHYPAPASMQWLDYSTKDEGLYFASYDNSLAFTGIQFEKVISEDKGDALATFFVKYPFAKSGEKWGSPKFALSLHCGDWHVGADKYRQWARSWMRKNIPPKWISNTHGFFLHVLKQQDGRIFDDYEDLPIIYEKASNMGIDTLYTLGWWTGGMDGDFPHYIPWDTTRLRQAIEKVHEKGGRVILYMNCRLMNLRLQEYKEISNKWSVKDMHGIDVREHWEWSNQYPYSFSSQSPPMYGETFLIPCPSIKEWRDLLKNYLRQIVREYGADGVEMDQIGIATAFLCFDDSHPHISPAYAFGPGLLEMIKEFKEEAQQKNSEFAILCEGVVDVYTQYTDLHYQLRSSHSPARNFPEMFRYTFPEVALCMGVGIDEYEMLNYSFLLGMKFDIHYGSIHVSPYRDPGKYPKYVSYIKYLINLRELARDYLMYGEFIDTRGVLSITPGIVAKLFKAKEINGVAIVLWNQTLEQKEVQINLDFNLIGLNDLSLFRVKNVDSNRYIQSPCGTPYWKLENLRNVTLGSISPNSVAVFIIEGKGYER